MREVEIEVDISVVADFDSLQTKPGKDALFFANPLNH